MQDVIKNLYQVVQSRKENAGDNSYTGYLFAEGTDKILKKCGEECAEVIIAAKNGEADATTGEICDLLYHLLVLMVNEGIPLEDVLAELDRRAKKIGNKKAAHQTDRES